MILTTSLSLAKSDGIKFRACIIYLAPRAVQRPVKNFKRYRDLSADFSSDVQKITTLLGACVPSRIQTFIFPHAKRIIHFASRFIATNCSAELQSNRIAVRGLS